MFVSRTAGVDETVDAADLYIEDANVKLINMSDSSELHFYSIGNGRYYPIDLTMQNIDSVSRYWLEYVISSGTTYRLVVNHEEDSVIAETSVPEKIEIAPIETQSPCLGNFFPKNICTRKATNGKNRI